MTIIAFARVLPVSDPSGTDRTGPAPITITLDDPVLGAYTRECLAAVLTNMAARTADEPPAADTMILEGLDVLDPYLERAEHLSAIHWALGEVAAPSESEVTWPFEHEALLDGLRGVIQQLRESVVSGPAADRLEKIVAGIRSAEALLAMVEGLA